jgi:DivIVA domain-containing protein
MSLTPEDVREVLFDKPPLGQRGYVEEEVDEFLDLVEEALAGDRAMSPDEVRRATFAKASLTRRGYDETQVDAFLDRVAAELAGRAGEPGAGPP